MLSAGEAITLLRVLRRDTTVTTPIGVGRVMAQLAHRVLVLVGWTIVEIDRWECEPVAAEVEYTEADDFTPSEREWFRKPISSNGVQADTCNARLGGGR